MGETNALIDSDEARTISYGELLYSSQKIQALAPQEKTLIFLFSRNRPDEIAAYIGGLNAGHTIGLFDGTMPAAFKQQLVKLYYPHYVLDHAAEQEGYEQIASPWNSLKAYRLINPRQAPRLHPHLQLLLATSGTTGNPKLIRLSQANLISNARSIIQYLKINPKERACASLPFHYSYGLSVLHSHLLAGASIVLTQSSAAQQPFWNAMQSYACTSLAGVPYTYRLMDRLGFEKIDLPALKTLTQAGGKLESSLVLKYHDMMRRRGGSFLVMYGQTEATARIAYLPPKHLPKKSEAIGIAIPGGKLQLYLEGHEITAPNQIGELVYHGPNVMLGYASSAEDLLKDDEMKGWLPTGDLGYFDAEGIYFITGRIKRISKVYGLRINLDDVETALSRFGIAAATTTDVQICIFLEHGSPELCEKCIRHLADLYGLHPSTFRCLALSLLPRTSSGKINYQQLASL